MYWRTMEIGAPPQDAFPVALLEVGPFFAQQAAGYALETVHEGDLRCVGVQKIFSAE